jgi:phospholipase/carboxylesterase
MHIPQFVTAGQPLETAGKVLILLHGRGSSARDILSLSQHLHVKDFALIAPQATNNTWYPFSFLAQPVKNEPWLSSALGMLTGLVRELHKKGFSNRQIYFAGFSQGACLTLEFVARNATLYGGVAAFTGGLIGDRIYTDNYTGSFAGTPVFIGTSDPDMHVPVERVQATTQLLQSMHAQVTEKIYPGMGHTITLDELQLANQLVFSKNTTSAQ